MKFDPNRLVLSYSSLQLLHDASHMWINKIAKVEQPAYEVFDPETGEMRLPFEEGKALHRIIQDHVSGKKKVKWLEHLDKYTFPIVEEVDFDERCKFEFNIGTKYRFMGFADGLNKEEKRILEIKTSKSGFWSVEKYRKSIQRKIYAYAYPWVKECVLITTHNTEQACIENPPKDIIVPVTEKDREEGLAWIMESIKIIEAGNFTGGLDENGFCNHYNCWWKEQCLFAK